MKRPALYKTGGIVLCATFSLLRFPEIRLFSPAERDAVRTVVAGLFEAQKYEIGACFVIFKTFYVDFSTFAAILSLDGAAIPAAANCFLIHMKRDTRHELISDLVRQKGFVRIEELARLCDVSTQTIRRDLVVMSREGLVLRHHGGAGWPSTKVDASFEVRRFSNVDSKQRMGRLLAETIPDSTSLFMSGGTTIEAASQALSERKDLMVVTNNLHAALNLHGRADCSVFVTDGIVRTSSGTATGEQTIASVERYYLDYAVVSTGGVTPDGVMLEFDHSVAGAIRSMMSNARKRVLMADQGKFTRVAAVRTGHLSEVDILITDRKPAGAVAELLEHHGVSVVF